MAGRAFYAAKNQCNLGCSYCFARFGAYTAPQPHFSVTEHDGSEVVYPTCDGEFAFEPDAQRALEALTELQGPPLLASISTKAALSVRTLSMLARCNDRLRRGRGGFIKISISISLKNELRNYESRTAPYALRLRNLKRLRDAGIASSVNLRPLLPQVPVSEYAEIVADCAEFTRMFLVGGLYLDPSSEFGRTMLDTYGHLASGRRVNWLPTKPIWPYIEDPAQVAGVRKAISNCGGIAFDDDLAVMQRISDSQI
jgi:hypothetical protein